MDINMLLVATGIFIVIGILCFVAAMWLETRGRTFRWLRPAGIALLMIGVLSGGAYWASHGSIVPETSNGSPSTGMAVETFAVIALLPDNEQPLPPNFTLRAVFNRALDPSVVTALTVTNESNNVIPGAYHVENEPGFTSGSTAGSIVYRALGSACPKDVKDTSCLKAGTYHVHLDANTLVDTKGEHLTCNTENVCDFSLNVGSAPLSPATIITPQDKMILPISSAASILFAKPADQETYLRVIVDRGQLSEHLVAAGVVEAKASRVSADLSSLQNNTSHLITLATVDALGVQHEQTTTMGMIIAHCTNGKQDEDELGLDCGGKDCLTCEAKK